MITGIHHTGMLVNNIENLLPFYRDFFGMKVIFGPELIGGPLTETITGISGAKVKAVILEINAQRYELIQLVEPPEKPLPVDVSFTQLGHGHIGFQTDNIEEVYKRIKEKDLQIIFPPQDISEAKFFYFKDPEGNPVEIFQPKAVV